MVKKVAWGMQEPVIQDWYSNNQARLDALFFKNYMEEWAVDIQGRNTLLRGTPSHLADANILYHLEAHMNLDLAADYNAEHITEPDLRKWIEKVRMLDEKRLCYIARQREAVEAAWRARAGERKLTIGTRFNSKAGQPTTSTTSSIKTFTRLPALTNNERQLLQDNDGCFKCREPFTGHTSVNCQNGFPDGNNYKMLMPAIIASKKFKRGTSVVASIEDIEDTFAVVMPSAVLGDGTDSEECVAPLKTPHLRWDCLIDSPAVSSPICVSALIDHGSSLVLIDELLSKQLGLKFHELPKPISITLALSQE
ncbi:hypothetical protein BDR07DRAFT_1482290 [Suillus spraguei]|nr:hypothetical protein BDR07DRAFT_1482290 [Suillus spraguei]